MLYVLLFSTVITVMLTIIQLYMDYKRDVSVIHDRIFHIELSNIASMNDALWTVDEQSIRIQSEGILKLPDIAELTIKDSSQNILFQQHDNEPITDNNIVRTFALAYTYKDKKIALGTLSITATLSNVYDRLWTTFFVILISQGIKTFLVSIFIMLIVYHLITQYLIKISESMQTFNLNERKTPLTIEKSKELFFNNNEIQELSQSVQQMQNDITKVYTELKLNEEMLSRSQHLSSTASWYMDIETRCVHWSTSIFNLLHLKDEQLSLEEFYSHIPEKERKSLIEQISKLDIEQKPVSLKHSLMTKDGHNLVVEHQIHKYRNLVDNRLYLLASINDITTHEYYQKELEYIANYDALTHLPNRSMLHKYMKSLIESKTPFVLSVMDLDGFKEVNDAIGHQSGDHLLQLIKPRLMDLLGADDIIARLGGDEFAFIILGLKEIDDYYARIQQLREAIKQPFKLDNIKVQIDGSFGLAQFPEQADNSSTLLRFADVAMYHAKRNKEGYCLYDSKHDMHSPRRLTLINDLGSALEKTQFMLLYQPKITLDDNRFDSVEALIRWDHPTFGMISPDEFIPLVEISDLIHSITLWVIETAINDTCQFRNSNQNFMVAINISTRNLQDIDFCQKVKHILDKLNCPASLLQLEITESAIMNDPDTALQTIKSLVALGIKISVDDFGTGYSSLSYLKHLPVEELKIDRSFVMNMDSNSNDFVIVRSTIDLAHNLGLRVVAEGIENESILEKLKQLKCDKGQGYHIAKPLNLEQLVDWQDIQKS